MERRDEGGGSPCWPTVLTPTIDDAIGTSFLNHLQTALPVTGDQGFIRRCCSGIILVVANVPGSNFDVAFSMEACVATVFFVLRFCVPNGGVPDLLAATTDGGPNTEPGTTEELLASSMHFSGQHGQAGGGVPRCRPPLRRPQGPGGQRRPLSPPAPGPRAPR